LFLDLSAVLIN